MKLKDRTQSPQREPVLPTHMRSTSLADRPHKPQEPLTIVSVEAEVFLMN